MKIISGNADFMLDKPSAVVIGKFDGIHLGHGLLLDKLLENKSKGLQTVVFTFDKSPAMLFAGEGKEYREICTIEEKRDIFANYKESEKMDLLIEFPMNARTVAMPAEKFITDILQKRLNCKKLIAGDDITFGHKGLGNSKLLMEFSEKCDFSLELVDKLLVKSVCQGIYETEKISSTLIRKLINEGKVADANLLMGRKFSVQGQVVHGKKLAGSVLQMPTANVVWPKQKVLPAFGVYLTCVTVGDQKYKAITNVGTKPTIAGTEVLAESYLYDFSGNLYGKEIKIEFDVFIRPESKFENLDALKLQMQQDMEKGRKYWK